MTKIKESMIDEERSSIEKYESELNQKMNFRKKMKDYFLSVKEKTLSNSRRSKIPNRIRTSLSY